MHPVMVREAHKRRLTLEDPTTWSWHRKIAQGVARRVDGPARRRDARRLTARIRATGPALSRPEGAQAAHMLLGSVHLNMALAAAKSLMLVADCPIRWTLHDDGTLSDGEMACLRDHLPGAIIVERREADNRAGEALEPYPTLLAWRSTGQVMPLKWLDVALWESAPRLLYVDSDVLFFREPSLLLREARAASGRGLFNRDLDTVYPVTPDAVRARFGFELLSRINAGLYVIDRAAVDLDRLEAWLTDPFFDEIREAYIVDQMLHAMLACGSEAGAGYLPDTYDMLFSKTVDRLVCRHYAGWFRHGFVLEGMAHLLNEREFERRWLRATRVGVPDTRESAPVPARDPRREPAATGPAARPRVLVAAYLHPPGGGSAVGAWTVQALRGPYALSVLTWDGVDLDRVNEAFGTTLTSADAEWLTVPPVLRRLLALWPTPAALLGISVTMRVIRWHAARARFDAIVGTMNELDVGRPAIQYIHYPWAKYPRPGVDYRWYHVEPAVRLYRWVARALAASQEGSASANVTLANSAWTARLFDDWYGRPCRVLYPPVVGGFPEVPWQSRERAFIAVGRISPEKELEKLVRILAAVRERGHAVRLRLAGHVDNRQYADRVRRLAATTGDWVEFHEDLPREALAALICRHRYGIHGMSGEHFGIAPAELQLAGCITFVPADGGQVEIVGRDDRVMYQDEADAVRKIVGMLSDGELESVILRDCLQRGELFSSERFEREMRAVVDEFLADQDDAAQAAAPA